MSHLVVQQNSVRCIQEHGCQCVDFTTKKIVVFIAGLLLLSAGLAMYYINLNSIASINSIASCTTIGVGGSLILGGAIWSVANWIQGKSVGHLEQVEEVTENNTPVSISDNLPVWKQNFKRRVLEDHRRALEEISSIDLTLTSEEEARLKTVIQELNTQYRTEKATVYSRNGIWVFSIQEIPGRIFKVKIPDCGADFHKRVDDGQKAQQVIEEENLYLLHVPKQAIIQLDINNALTEVLIEEQFDILHGIEPQESLFQYCIADPELQSFVLECARQLVILILKTGYSDVRYDNNPLLTNGKGIGLIDLDTSESIITGLVIGRNRTCMAGILYCLSVELLESLEPLLRSNLSEEDFNQLKIEQIKKHLAEDADRNLQFNRYLTDHRITTGREQVTLQGLFGFSDYIKELQKTINESASKNPGLCLTAERKFYIYKWCSPNTLDQLKAKGKIFDWMEVTARTSSGLAFGYYVWC